MYSSALYHTHGFKKYFIVVLYYIIFQILFSPIPFIHGSINIDYFAFEAEKTLYMIDTNFREKHLRTFPGGFWLC